MKRIAALAVVAAALAAGTAPAAANDDDVWACVNIDLEALPVVCVRNPFGATQLANLATAFA